MLRPWRKTVQAAALALVFPLSFAGVRDSYSGIDPEPPGSQRITTPKLRGELIAMFDEVEQKAAFTITGSCQGRRFVLGPLITDLLGPFNEFMTRDTLEGYFLDGEKYGPLFHLPEGCFGKQQKEEIVIVGLVIQEVVNYRLLSPQPPHTPTFVLAKVVLAGVYFPSAP